jgi:hypothetical protein
MALEIGSAYGLAKTIPSWVWKSGLGYVTKIIKKWLGTHLEWEVWDAAVYGIEKSSKTLVILRASNRTSAELKNISLVLEPAMGDPKDLVIRILPFKPAYGRLHMDMVVFNNMPLERKPRQRVIKFDLPPESSWRIEIEFPHSCGGFPLELLSGCHFVHPSARIKQKQRDC